MTISPDDRAFQLLNGFRASQVVHAAAELHLPDLIAAGRTSIAELSAATEVDESRMRRLVRALVALGVLTESGGGLANTVVGELFRDGVPGSRRALSRMLVPEGYRDWDHFMETLRTGITGESQAFGGTLWQHIAADQDFAARFNVAMAANSEAVARFVAQSGDFSGVTVVADIGGGTGALLAAVLSAHSSLRGIVFDVPAGLAATYDYMAARGLLDRCSIVEGDFFESAPAADLYLLKDILHDWDDDHATQILRVCRKAMPTLGRVMIVERVLPSRVTEDPVHVVSTMTDLHMMVMLGGQERTLEEFGELFAKTGLALQRFTPGDVFHLVEAKAI